MFKIPPLLTNRMKFVSTMITKVNKYLTFAKDVIIGMNVSDYNLILDSIQVLTDAIPSLPSIVTGETKPDELITRSSELYDYLEIVDKHMQRLVDITDNETYTKMALFNMSSSHVMDFRKEKNLITTLYKKYLTESVSEDEAILNSLVNTVNVNSAYKYILENETKINKFTIRLIIFLLSLPSESTKTPEKIISDEHRRRLEVLIEKQKDRIIGATRIDISSQPGTQGILVRYGLRPSTMSMTIDELAIYLLTPNENEKIKKSVINTNTNASNGSKKSGSSENKLRSLADEHGLIVINRANTSPIEFDLRGLLDTEYIIKNELEIANNSGLTKKVIAKYQTTKNLPLIGEDASPITIIPGKKPTWRIVETINGNLYRVLAINDEEIINSDQIVGLVGDQSSTDTVGLSTRCYQYNILQSNAIIPQLFDEKISGYVKNYNEKISTQASPEYIAATITEKLLLEFDAGKVDTPLINEDRFHRLAANDTIISRVLFEVLKHTLGAYGRGSEEFMVTYLVNIDAIVSKFHKEIDYHVAKMLIPDRLFRENTQEEVDKVLYDMYRQMIIKITAHMAEIGVWKNYDSPLKSYIANQKQAIII